MKRVEVNDSESIYVLANYYFQGLNGIQQDHTKAIGLFPQAANLGLGKANWNLADINYKGGDLKKARFHCEAAAMKGHEVSRCNLGCLEYQSGNMERAVKHVEDSLPPHVATCS
jgi:TPR repeat protein